MFINFTRQKLPKPIAIASTSTISLSLSLYPSLSLPLLTSLAAPVHPVSLSLSELTQKAHLGSLENTASTVYLCLLKVQLALSSLPTSASGGTSGSLSSRDALNLTITTAEKYCDRLDPCDVLDILPPSAPLALLQTFLGKSIEHANSRKRNLQVPLLPCSLSSPLFSLGRSFINS
jgi:hypothetical protein